MMEVVVTTGAVRRAKLQSNRRHEHTTTQRFTGRMLFLLPNQQCQSIEGSYYSTISYRKIKDKCQGNVTKYTCEC